MKHLLYWLHRAVRCSQRMPARFDKNHIILASYPKAGNTWMRFIVSNVSVLMSAQQREVDFHSIRSIAPMMERHPAIDPDIRSEEVPVFLTTHLPFHPRFRKYKSVVLIREPADMMVSLFHQVVEGYGQKFASHEELIRHWRWGMDRWVYFYRQWLGNETILIHYEDLLSDAVGVVSDMYDRLGYQIPEELIEQAVARSSMARMRDAQMAKGDPMSSNPSFSFVRKGTSGEGEQILSTGDVDYIARKSMFILQTIKQQSHR